MAIGIVSCGQSKLDGRHQAGDLYTSSHFRLQFAAAVANFGRENVWILSAKFGLVHANTEIDSYNVKWGDAGTITDDELSAQIESLVEHEAYAFLPRRGYWETLWRLSSELFWFPCWVNEADAGIGYQGKTAAVCRDTAHLSCS